MLDVAVAIPKAVAAAMPRDFAVSLGDFDAPIAVAVVAGSLAVAVDAAVKIWPAEQPPASLVTSCGRAEENAPALGTWLADGCLSVEKVAIMFCRN